MAGRPRKLSIEETLDRALEVFWNKGYASTSIGDLSEAVGVGPSSLYNSFGSKAGLFLRCLERYRGRDGTTLMEPLESDMHVVDALVRVLETAAVRYATDEGPAGCAVMSAGRVTDQECDAHLLQTRQASMAYLQQRIARSIDAGELKSDTDAAALGRFVAGLLAGLSTQARDGASAEELLGSVYVSRHALECFRA